MKFKLIIPILLSCAYIAGSSVCFAAPAVTKAETSETEALETTRTETKPVETETVTAPITEPPVTTPSYYDEILKYVGDENAPQLDENLQNNGLTIDKSVIDYSQKSMYTITSRSGDVFYLIINSSDGSVYFLNSVDTSDLTALLSEDSQKAGNEINQSALENIRQTETETDISGAVQSKTETVNNKKTDKEDETMDEKTKNELMAAVASAVSEVNSKWEEYWAKVDALQADISQLKADIAQKEADIKQLQADYDKEYAAKEAAELGLTEANAAKEAAEASLNEANAKIAEMENAATVAELNAALAPYTEEQRAVAQEEIDAFNANPGSVEINSIIGKICTAMVEAARESKVIETSSANQIDVFGMMDDAGDQDDGSADVNVF